MRQPLKKPTAARGDAAAAAFMKSPEQFTGQYSQCEEKASGIEKLEIWGGFKFKWLDQVSADHRISGQAFRLAYVLVSQFLDRRTREAWPSESTLANELGIKERQIRNLVGEIVAHGHLSSRRGGKGRSNRYSCILFDRQDIADQDRRTNADDRQSNDGLTGNELTFDRQDIAANSRKEPGLEPGRGRALSAPPTEPGQIGDSDSPVAALNAARSVLPILGEIITFSDGKWIITSAPVMDYNRNLRTFMARKVNGSNIGTESDFVIYPDGAIEQDLPF